ncbi:adenosine kinase [Ferrimicrobium acidiphilum]|uniref:Putative sugar kinase YdjH n=1 Tax=Ferrimicrobium acidiphilum DSM 19497 TaxID=1121877 RepID=A0A0D8FYT1_9ACTN|nr:adenosine kinase [Ferrimicrobium acidiphilum]KJE77812.1 putative sugar kinase YdjH [Ferrimicrobium acidiphilum DSM 19497]MCL5054175.1 adenosine kinase [Gammaproteobacteria bacterium]
MKPVTVLGFGSAIVDVSIPVADTQLRQLGLTKGSMRLATREEQERIIGSLPGDWDRQGGGSIANSLVGLSLLGVDSALYTAIGGDSDGNIFTRDLSELGVEVVLSEQAYSAGTGRCVVLVTEDGQRTMLTYLGASQELSAELFPFKVATGTPFLFVEGYLLDVPGLGDRLFEVARTARRYGTKVVFSLSDAGLVERHLKSLQRLLPASVDYLLANGEEASAFTQRSDLDQIVEVLSNMRFAGAVTLGDRGALYFGADRYEYLEAPTYAHAVDTTGAGDLFAAGFIAGLVHELNPVDALRLGQALAAEVIAHPGARPQVDLGAWLAEHEPDLANT